MNKKKVYFRADAGQSIGYGHFIRSLALADMLKDDFDCTFFTVSPSVYQVEEMAKVCHHGSLNEDSKFEDFLKLLHGNEIVVLDNFFFTTEYQKEIRNKGCKLVCMGDTQRHFFCDALINHSNPNPDAFSVEPFTKLYLGFDYALLRKPFLTDSCINKNKGHWFVSFGGSDYDNLTAKFVSMLNASSLVTGITVVLGDAYKFHKSLDNFSKAVILSNISAMEMRIEMSKAEFALIPSSSLCVEALASGCKVVSGFFVDNQIDFYGVLKSNHAVFPLGDFHLVSDSFFIEKSLKFAYKIKWNFSGIPSRFINVFNNL